MVSANGLKEYTSNMGRGGGGETKKNWEIDRMIMWPMCSFDLESFAPILLAHIFAFIILKIKAV